MSRRIGVLLLIALVIIALVAGGLAWYIAKHKTVPTVTENPVYPGFKLSSPAFKNGENIPVKYTCKGGNVSPPLRIVGAPAAAKSFALLLHDPNAVGGDFIHWTVWNIDPTTQSIDEGQPPATATQGSNGTDNSGYIGPCPPAGTGVHHYIFDLYAVDSTLNLPEGAPATKLKAELKGHAVALTKLTGLVSAD